MEIYLDQAATSHPKPPEVITAVHKALTDQNANPGRSGHSRALAGSRLLMEARQTVASLIHAPSPECVVFCFNGTDALNMAIKGALHVGDHVVTSVLEHNSVLRVLEELRSRRLISVSYVSPGPDGSVYPADFLAALKPRTRLCILTHVSNVTGTIQPCAEIGKLMKSNGVLFLIDGAQALGHIPVDVQTLHCDLYAAPGHKGLLAPAGTGILYIAPELPLNALREGGTGSSSDSVRQPTERPERFESGTVNLPGIAGLRAGANIILKNEKTIARTENELTDMLFRGLSEMKNVALCLPQVSRNRIGVAAFNIGDLNSSEAADLLNDRGIAVRAGLHCAPLAHNWLGTLHRGAVRASISWQNTPNDVEALFQAIRTIG